MRHVTISVLFAVATTTLGGAAYATPFEPATIPDQAQAVGHLDVDALRKTQIFNAVGGQAAIDAALDEAPPAMRPVAQSLAHSARGVSFWHGTDHGALYLETRDARALNQMLPRLPGSKLVQSVDGWPTYEVSHGDKTHYAAAYNDTLILADSDESLALSIHALGGKAPNLAGSNKLPVASRQGVFVFVTVGDALLSTIQKTAQSRMAQLALRSVVVDVGESGGMVTATARAEMRTADAVQKARAILDGLRALASLSDDLTHKMLLDGLTVGGSGLSVDVTARVPIATVIKMVQDHHHPRKP